MKKLGKQILLGVGLISAILTVYSTSARAKLIPATVYDRIEKANFKYKFGDRHNIEYRVYLENIAKNHPWEGKDIALKIEFPYLDFTQFQILSIRYGGKSQIPWEPGRVYSLIDFLPPKLQAIDKSWLSGTSEPGPEIPREYRNPYENYDVPSISTSMNCWTTAWELLRDWDQPNQSLRIGYFGGPDTLDVFLDSKYHAAPARDLKRQEIFAETSITRNQGRQLGDLLLIRTLASSSYSIAHAALWIDEDIYFEKTNSAGNDPIRLATWSMVVHEYLDQDSELQPIQMNFIRTIGARNKLPDQREFGKGTLYTAEGAPELPAEVSDVRFSMDVGLGGSLKEYSANRFIEFPIVIDPETHYGKAPGADTYYGKQELICDSFDWGDDTYSYKIFNNGKIEVINNESKNIVAELQGEFGLYEAHIAGKTRTVGYSATSGTGNKIMVYSDGIYGHSLSLAHEGVDSEIIYGCNTDRIDVLAGFGR